MNSYCMRMSEMNKGVKIYDELGDEIGISKVTAKQAVMQTASSRLLLAFPIITFPGFFMFTLEKLKLVPKAKPLRVATEIGVVAFSLWIALPISVSLFPQKGEILARDVEQEFQQLKNKNGELIERYYYNKGL